MKNFRHGDVNIKEVSKIEGDEVKNDGSYVLAYGEVTGHKHILSSEGLKVFKTEDGRMFLSLNGNGTLTHEEHKPLTIQSGNYEVVFEREKDWFQNVVRRVID